MSREERECVGLQEAWLRYQRKYGPGSAPGDDPDWWAVERLMEYPQCGEMEQMWEAITGLCGRLDWNEEPQIVGVLGAGPLEDFVVAFGDRAMDLIDAKLDSDDTLLKALACVWRWDDPIRGRVDRALTARGQELL